MFNVEHLLFSSAFTWACVCVSTICQMKYNVKREREQERSLRMDMVWVSGIRLLISLLSLSLIRCADKNHDILALPISTHGRMRQQQLQHQHQYTLRTHAHAHTHTTMEGWKHTNRLILSPAPSTQFNVLVYVCMCKMLYSAIASATENPI